MTALLEYFDPFLLIMEVEEEDGGAWGKEWEGRMGGGGGGGAGTPGAPPESAAGEIHFECSADFFSFLHLFQTCFSDNIFKQVVGPSVLLDLQPLSCKA